MASSDTEEPLWHFQDGSPTVISQELPKLQEKKKTHSYLADVQCNLLFYLQTETYGPGLFADPAHQAPPPPLHFSPFTALIYSCRSFSLTICLFVSSPPPPLIFIYTILSVSRPLSHQSCLFSAQFTLDITVLVVPPHPPPTAPSPSKPQDRLLSSCVRRCLAPLGPLRACVHLKRFTETHICCFRAQRDFRRGRGPFEVASRGEPEPERAASSQEP